MLDPAKVRRQERRAHCLEGGCQAPDDLGLLRGELFAPDRPCVDEGLDTPGQYRVLLVHVLGERRMLSDERLNRCSDGTVEEVDLRRDVSELPLNLGELPPERLR